MRLQSRPILSQLSDVLRRNGQGGSRRVRCPTCRIRTTLYRLGDGRRKCGSCGLKFTARRKADAVRLRQCADVLLCFCLDLTAAQASKVTGQRYRLVSAWIDVIRKRIAVRTLPAGKMRLMTAVLSGDRGVHDSSFCTRCRGKPRCNGRMAGDAPVFGVRILSDGSVFAASTTMSGRATGRSASGPG